MLHSPSLPFSLPPSLPSFLNMQVGVLKAEMEQRDLQAREKQLRLESSLRYDSRVGQLRFARASDQSLWVSMQGKGLYSFVARNVKKLVHICINLFLLQF